MLERPLTGAVHLSDILYAARKLSRKVRGAASDIKVETKNASLSSHFFISTLIVLGRQAPRPSPRHPQRLQQRRGEILQAWSLVQMQ